MATYSFHNLDFTEFGVTGADPFADPKNTSAAAVGSVITLDPNASWSTLSVDDDEAMLHDNDAAPAPSPVSDVDIGGVTYFVGAHVETEYSYFVRLASSSDPADNFTVYSISMDGVIVGFASDASMDDGQSYSVISEGSLSPFVLYDDLIVCFAEGTMILPPTASGRSRACAPATRW